MLVTFRVKNVVSFCVKKLLHFALKSCHILRQKLLHFGLMLHFASKVVTFRVNVTFCINCYILRRNKDPISVADLLLLSITCLQNLYYAGIYLIPTTLETLKISLLFYCHGPITIEIASATAGLFCGTVYPLM